MHSNFLNIPSRFFFAVFKFWALVENQDFNLIIDDVFLI